MTLASLVERPHTPPVEAARDRSAPGRVTGKLRIALDRMVWHGDKRVEAAEAAGMSEHSLYVALRKPHVRAYYLAQLDVLRTSERARNIFTLTEVRDQTSNQMARVAAVKALEQLDDEATTPGGRSTLQAPGFMIQVIVQGAAQPSVSAQERQIEAKPLIEHEMGAGTDSGRET